MARLANNPKQNINRRPIYGYASRFGMKDRHHDMVLKGAFVKTLRAWNLHNRWPKMLWQHQPTQPIGRWDKMWEDDKGLYVQGELNFETQQGQEAYALLKQGAIEGLSIGFQTIKSRYIPRTKTRELLDLDLLEVSLVTFAANEGARVLRI